MCRAWVYHGFLTDEECDHLVTLVSSSLPSFAPRLTPIAEPIYQPPSVVIRLCTFTNFLLLYICSMPGKSGSEHS